MARKPPAMTKAVAAALRDAEFLARDQGTVALAKRYAQLIDEAEEIAAALDGVEPGGDYESNLLAKLKARVDAYAVASELGPKLLAALAALAMTPQSRAANGKGTVNKVASPAADALAALRERRASARRD